MDNDKIKKENFNKSMNFATHSVDYVRSKDNKAKKYSVTQITKALEDPVKNYKLLQETSLYLANRSFTYRRLLSHFSNMVNFDIMLVPTVNLVTRKNKSLANRNYYESANLLDRMNHRHTLKWINESLWKMGEVYIYEIEDKDGIVFKKMPEQICRISSVISNSVCLYSIDLSTLSNVDLLATMPLEIQKLYEKFVNKSIPTEKLVDGKWYELTDNAVAFNIVDPFLHKGYPMLSPIFPSLLALEESNDTVSEDEELDNLKIIHMTYDVDDTGSSIIDPSLITQFHAAVKENLPEGCCVATNPLKMSVHTTKSANQSTNYRTELQDVVYSSVGSSKELFNGTRNSNMAISVSTKADEVFALSKIGIFENYINYKLQKGKKTSCYSCKILPTTHFNISDYKRECETSLSITGNGNQLRYLACCGYSPLEAMGLLDVEEVLGVSDKFRPALNGYNTSTEGLTENGRPSNEDSGEVVESDE